jgi:N-acetylmuramoyl-L-alanine amidase
VRRRLALLSIPLVVLAAACSSGDERAASTTAPRRTTTTAAPTTTTTAPPRYAPIPQSGPVVALRTPNGVIVPVRGLRDGAYVVETPCSREALVRGGTPLYGATVVLDPGHGGKETGSVGANDLVERDLNLAVALRTKAALEAEGATVVLTRERDYEMTLAARANVAKQLKPLAFISIHHNGGPDEPSDEPGTEMYYQHASVESKRLAGLLYDEVHRAFATQTGVSWFANVDAGAKYRLSERGGDYYGILRNAAGVPSVLSEALFLSASPSEAALLARPEVQDAEAAAIARAVRRYVFGSDPGRGFVTPIVRLTPAGGGGTPQGCVDTPL